MRGTLGGHPSQAGTLTARSHQGSDSASFDETETEDIPHGYGVGFLARLSGQTE